MNPRLKGLITKMIGQILQNPEEQFSRLAAKAKLKLIAGDHCGAEAIAAEGLRLLDQDCRLGDERKANELRQRFYILRREARHPNPSRLRRLVWRLSDRVAEIAVAEVNSRREA